MKLKNYPAKHYLFVFLVSLFVIYLSLNTKLYFDAEEIREKTYQKTYELAQQELQGALTYVENTVNAELKRLTEWDEVHQQLAEPSYYFYWHDERLMDSSYWQSYYDSLELYKADREILQQKSRGSSYDLLPKMLSQENFQLTIVNEHPHLIAYKEVTTGNKTTGFVAINIDLIPLISDSYKFTYLDFNSINYEALNSFKHSFTFDDFFQMVTFNPVKNPVNDFLWELIQNFLFTVILFGILFTLLYALFFKFTTLNALARLNQYLSELKAQPNQVIIPEKKSDFFQEFQHLKEQLFTYNKELVNAQNELDSQRQLAYEQSRLDSLTKILNRRAFDEHLDNLFIEFHKTPRPVGFVLFDCDYFKAINDTYGREVGDSVIRTTAQVFKDALPDEVEIFRIGGDEFTCIIENQDIETCYSIAEKALNSIKAYDFSHLGITEKISFSVGISFINKDNEQDLALMYKQADIALYKAKGSLHQKIQVYNQQQSKVGSTLASAETITRIIHALNTGEGIQMHFQPIERHEKDQIDYYESLLRIEYKDGLIYPGEIFEVVNHRHLHKELDKQVIDHISGVLSLEKLPLSTGVSVNISAETLLQEDLNALLLPLESLLQKYKIVIEVVEDTLIANLDVATNKLEELRRKGFQIALDDFGSGYSSIRYLAHMPVDIIKFDMSLTHALLADYKTHKIVMTTAQMIRTAGYNLVMEGIEDQAQLNAAIDAGATHCQGYFLGKPMPTNQLKTND